MDAAARASRRECRQLRVASMSQRTLSELNACSKDDFVATLANVFEYSPWIAEQAASARPFAGVTQLFDAMKTALDRAAPELRLALIKAHPDLADKTQRAAGLTIESSAEQDSIGLDRLSEAEYQAFERVNTAYRAKFGFPYIVCVRRHTKDFDPARFRTPPAERWTDGSPQVGRGNLPDRGAAHRSAGGVGRQAAGARPALDPCARHPWRQTGGGDSGRTG